MTESSKQSSARSTTASPILLVNERQKGNPLLRFIKNIRWEYSQDTIADYAMTSSCVIFVSIKYHNLHNTYTQRRLREMGDNYRLRVLLVYVDDANTTQPLLELNKLCFTHNFTLILAWSDLECARYIETLKEFEGKSSVSIQEKVETEYHPRATKLLTTVRSVNKTDVSTLLEVFGNLSNVCSATEQQLMLCPGLGEKKVRRLYQVLNEPFQKRSKIEDNISSLSTGYSILTAFQRQSQPIESSNKDYDGAL